MIKISHRGNINGREIEKENEPSFIDLAISKGYQAEIDVWMINDSLYLGHDHPQYVIPFEWLVARNEKLWIHCKNVESLAFLIENGEYLNFFWHQEDDMVLTSKKYIWTYPGKILSKKSIAVLPELKKDWNLSIALGICSDYVSKY
jgi:hypothetical protein